MPAGNDITNLIRFIRMDIGDDGDTQTFTDTQIVTMVAKATIRLDAELGGCLSVPTSGGLIQFEQSSTSGTFSASGTFVLPTGASSSGLPSQLFNLVMLRAECMLAKRQQFDSAGKAIRVRDGDTEIDTSVGFGGLRDLVSGKGGPCDEYQSALKTYCDWLDGELNGNITDWATIIWKGNMEKSKMHTSAGPDGGYKTEVIGDFTDYLRSDGESDAGDGSRSITGPTR